MHVIELTELTKTTYILVLLQEQCYSRHLYAEIPVKTKFPQRKLSEFVFHDGYIFNLVRFALGMHKLCV